MGSFWDGYFQQDMADPSASGASAPGVSSAFSIFSALPLLPRAHTCLLDEWVSALELTLTAFLIGLFVGCLGGGVVRTAFWFQLVPLVFGACLVYVAVYIM